MQKIYTTKYINIISFVITAITFLIINIICNLAKNPSIFQTGLKDTVKIEFDDNSENQNSSSKEEVNKTQNENKTAETSANNQNKSDIDQKNWYLKIPRIFLEAEISEGTSKETMNKYIGHFEDTQKKEGNICLAAHNRGYPVNYFQNLKLLKKGDKIQYKFEDFKKEYEVSENYIIKDTDWTCMERTEENTITLITCIENEPEYRRCVKGIEIKSNKQK